MFGAEHNSTDRDGYEPFTELTTHSTHYLELAQKPKLEMEADLRRASMLTDLMALRAGELPETH